MTRSKGRRIQKMTTPVGPNDSAVEPHAGELNPNLSDDKESYEAGFYNVHDGLKGRDGGPYLDHVLRQTAEVNRARLEGREPADLNGVLPADAGTPLVVASQVIDNSLMSNPSMRYYPGFETVISDKGIEKHGEDNWAVTSPVATVTVDARTEAPDDAGDNTRNDAPSEASKNNPTVADENGKTTKSKNYVGDIKL